MILRHYLPIGSVDITGEISYSAFACIVQIYSADICLGDPWKNVFHWQIRIRWYQGDRGR